MRCAGCGSDNAADHRFCAQCGAPLTETCPACGFKLPAGARFCGGCGRPLGAAEPGPA
ncbi:MAG: zinc ribbon domain-containing protein, partial [Rhodospirillaceae bacterium]|nr:zinc ribbon domain-containing protein [Rhodospirillaceae bacterium]